MPPRRTQVTRRAVPGRAAAEAARIPEDQPASTTEPEPTATADADSARPGRRSRSASEMAAVVVLGLVITVLLLPIARTTGDVGPGAVSLELGIGRDGTTQLDVPPLGRVVVDSHTSPVVLHARVETVDLQAAGRLANQPDPRLALQDESRDQLLHLVLYLAARVLAVAFCAGAVAGLLIPGRSWRHALLGGLACTLAIAAAMVVTWRTYSTGSFASPRFEGTLERAPEALDAVQREYESLTGLRDRMQILAGQITTLTAQAASPESVAPRPDEVRILHISDVHLNPIGLEIARSLARQFDVAAILDTGDLTSFGLPYESEIGRLVSTMPVPYYLVPGNHDSPSNRDRLATIPNLTLLDGESATIEGITVLGAADPETSVAPDEDGVTGAEAREARLAAAPDVAALTAAIGPDVLAVAGLQLADGVAGTVPLVVSGDIHERSSEERDGTLFLTVGTTGAGGIGRFTNDTGRPYSAEVLRFVGGRLAGLDYVTIDGLDGAFSVDRVVYPVAARAAGAGPSARHS